MPTYEITLRTTEIVEAKNEYMAVLALHNGQDMDVLEVRTLRGRVPGAKLIGAPAKKTAAKRATRKTAKKAARKKTAKKATRRKRRQTPEARQATLRNLEKARSRLAKKRKAAAR